MRKIEGLIPAVVQDFYTGSVLMLAYVNQESYDYMRERGETCFWSRSRKELWHKGETSGNVQIIKNMTLDCDGDALLIQVEQRGEGACHTGAYSCFGGAPAAFSVIDEVFAAIGERMENPKEASYTNYLLREGIDKVLKKIGEESAEVIIAAKNESQADLIGEISDLVYHTLVLMLTRGVAPRDVRAALEKRREGA